MAFPGFSSSGFTNSTFTGVSFHQCYGGPTLEFFFIVSFFHSDLYSDVCNAMPEEMDLGGGGWYGNAETESIFVNLFLLPTCVARIQRKLAQMAHVALLLYLVNKIKSR